jgi:hypothetical protein
LGGFQSANLEHVTLSNYSFGIPPVKLAKSFIEVIGIGQRKLKHVNLNIHRFSFRELDRATYAGSIMGGHAR